MEKHLLRSRMAATVTLYVDPISPYVWLAAPAIDTIEAAGATVHIAPVLFAGLLNHHGQKGPAEIPAKRAYTFRDVMRQAALLGLPFRGPPGHPFNPLLPLRMLTAIADHAERRALLRAFLRACWEQGADISSPASAIAVAGECGLDGAALAALAATPAVKQALAGATDAAIAAGVFGVPTFRLGAELFWGSDRVGALIAHLQGASIDEAALARFLASAPLAQRPQS
jgi:2-hydroxychromene-2-carboxylate isomerase